MGGMDFDTGGKDFSTGPLEAITEDRLSTPGLPELGAEGESYADASCKIAIFDNAQSQPPETDANGDQSAVGFSRNTRKAITFLKKELDAQSSQSQDHKLHFTELSQKANRRTASSFFFELLVLGTKDYLNLKQTKPYSNIEISGKTKLWNQQSSSFASQPLSL